MILNGTSSSSSHYDEISMQQSLIFSDSLKVLNLRSLTWSKVEVSAKPESSEVSPVPLAPCAGHSLIPWENKLISIAGHTKDPTETITVKAFDLQSSTWSTLRTYGEPPISRGCQSVTLVGTTLVIFGGEDASRSLLNDLHILDLETITWDDIDTVGTPPSPRSDHAAAVHAERYLLIFGGGSHATCFNDLHVLDLETGNEKYRCSETGYRIPLKCIKKKTGKKSKKSRSTHLATQTNIR